MNIDNGCNMMQYAAKNQNTVMHKQQQNHNKTLCLWSCLHHQSWHQLRFSQHNGITKQFIGLGVVNGQPSIGLQLAKAAKGQIDSRSSKLMKQLKHQWPVMAVC